MVDCGPLTTDDADAVRDLLERHRDETGSHIAAQILESGDLDRFTLIMPRDYRRALEAQRRAELDGRDPAEAVMEAARG
jgi:glutamate synthase (NADPH/NADH) large chain